jgi:DNA-binding beta-propeller fold protein YncE
MIKSVAAFAIFAATVVVAAQAPTQRATSMAQTMAQTVTQTVTQTATSSCAASPSSLTPATFHRLIPTTHAPGGAGLTLVKELALPGLPNRFDYQSFDPATRRMWMNHMDAGETIVFSTASAKVIAVIHGVPRATGVLAVPSLHRTFISAAGAHELVTIDDRTLKIVGREGGIQFPDGIAYVPDAGDAGKIFVSDEAGGADVVVDARTGKKRSTIPLGGEAGNTHYDSVSHCVLVAQQTTNELIAIDPVSEKIVQRYPLPGAEHPHGFTMDQPGRLLFMSCEGNARLLVIDMTTMKVIGSRSVGDSPDVLAWDPAWRRLYVASEGGLVSAFWADGTTLRPAGEYRAAHAHTVGLDTRSHQIFLPLENVGGHPALLILRPAS